MVPFQTTPANADCLIKAINYSTQLSPTRRVSINNSTIVGSVKNGCGAFRISLDKAIGTGLDLAFIYEAEKLRQLHSFRNSKDKIHIFDRNDYYEITDKEMSVTLWKCSVSKPSTVFNDPSKFKPIGVPVTVKDLEAVKKAKRSTLPYAYLNVVQDQLISLAVPGFPAYNFDPDAYDEKADGPSIELKSMSALMLPGKKATLSIAKMGGDYWLLATVEIALGSTVEVQEHLMIKRSNR